MGITLHHLGGSHRGGISDPDSEAFHWIVGYLETSTVRVQGLVTGRRYEFSLAQSVQSVDARDASSLLNTRFFSRA